MQALRLSKDGERVHIDSCTPGETAVVLEQVAVDVLALAPRGEPHDGAARSQTDVVEIDEQTQARSDCDGVNEEEEEEEEEEEARETVDTSMVGDDDNDDDDDDQAWSLHASAAARHRSEADEEDGEDEEEDGEEEGEGDEEEGGQGMYQDGDDKRLDDASATQRADGRGERVHGGQGDGAGPRRRQRYRGIRARPVCGLDTGGLLRVCGLDVCLVCVGWTSLACVCGLDVCRLCVGLTPKVCLSRRCRSSFGMSVGSLVSWSPNQSLPPVLA